MATSSLSLPFSKLPLILAAFQSAGHVGVCAFVCWLLNESSKWRGKPLESQVRHTHTHTHGCTHVYTHTQLIHINISAQVSWILCCFCFSLYHFALSSRSISCSSSSIFFFHNLSAWFSVSTHPLNYTHIFPHQYVLWMWATMKRIFIPLAKGQLS